MEVDHGDKGNSSESEKKENVESVKGQDPYDIVPEDVWKLIFNYLARDPEALLACSEVTEKWTDAMKQSQKYFRFYEAFPLIRKYLSFKDTLNLRLVHPSWKKSVDKFYQDFDSHGTPDVHWDSDKDTLIYFKSFSCSRDVAHQQRLHNEGVLRKRIFHDGPSSTDPSYYKILRENLYCFHTSGDFHKFFNLMPASNGNSFLTRCVKLSVSGNFMTDEQNDERTKYQALDIFIRQFLPNYGSFVHYFIMDEKKLTPLETYRLLHTTLPFMPNLKILTVGPDQLAIGSAVLPPSPPSMNDLISASPLEGIKSIAVLKLRFVPVAILLELLRKCPQVTKLEFTYVHSTFGLGCPCCLSSPTMHHSQLAVVNNEVMPNVKELTLIYEYPISGNQPYLKVNCPSLETITFAVPTNLKTVILETVRYRETLRNLTASVDLTEAFGGHLQFDLPNLENLKLTIFFELDPTFPSLDFISPLKSVQKLHLIFDGWTDEKELDKVVENKNERLKISGLFHRMYESNIWDLLPNLKYLSLEIGFCIGMDHFNNTPDKPSIRWKYIRADRVSYLR